MSEGLELEPTVTKSTEPIKRLSTENESTTEINTTENTNKTKINETEEIKPETKKRSIEIDFQPVLIRLSSDTLCSNYIRISKDQFKIGRKPDNDEVIPSVLISRNHCVLQRAINSDNWFVTNLSSTDTLLNDKQIPRNTTRVIRDEDILQLSLSDSFRYKFIYVKKENEPIIKHPKMESNQYELDNFLDQQRSFVAIQENERKDLEKQLSNKQLEQETLKEELEKLLQDQKLTKTYNEELNNQIIELQKKIETSNSTELELQQKYRDLLEKLEEERFKFEEKLANEKQKCQQILLKTNEQMEELKENLKRKQQEEWQKRIDDLLIEEKNIQSKLQDEKQLLEQKLKEMEGELIRKEEQSRIQQQLQLEQQEKQRLQLQEQKEQLKQQQAIITQPIDIQNCIIVEISDADSLNLNNQLPVLETIDLTNDIESTSSNLKSWQNETIIDKVNNIMDEQLTCSICSELFVRAMTLNCTHTFCRFCIDMWIKKSKECPNCRANIVSMTRSLVVDNFIEKMLESLTPEQMQKRKQLIEERRRYSLLQSQKKKKKPSKKK